MISKYVPVLVCVLFILLNGSQASGKRKSKKAQSESGSGSPESSTSQSEEKQAAIAQCGKTYDLEAVGSLKINAGYEKHCTWTILGSSRCQPEMSCRKIELRGDGIRCDDNYLLIEDGVGGEHKVCGITKLSKRGVRASYGARDLFLTLKGHQGGKVTCEAYCGKQKKKSLPDFLGKLKKKKADLRCVCGVQNLDDRIVNGEDAKRGEFPWQVAIVNKGTRSPTCGGSLINDRFILTASHCFWFSNTTTNQIDVLLHAHLLDFTFGANYKYGVPLGQNGSIQGSGWNRQNASDNDERTVRVTVDEIIMHPLFTEKYDYDVALLRLSKPLDLSSIEATPICLPKVGDRRDYTGQVPTVTGWGMPDENAGSTTRLLQKLNVPVIANDICSKMMEFDLTDRMLCAGFQQGVQDACLGDSGGPLVLKGPKNQYQQIGVVSWGEGCARKDRPGVYSRLTDLGEWVQYHTRKNNAVWCRDTLEAGDN